MFQTNNNKEINGAQLFIEVKMNKESLSMLDRPFYALREKCAQTSDDNENQTKNRIEWDIWSNNDFSTTLIHTLHPVSMMFRLILLGFLSGGGQPPKCAPRLAEFASGRADGYSKLHVSWRAESETLTIGFFPLFHTQNLTRCRSTKKFWQRVGRRRFSEKRFHPLLLVVQSGYPTCCYW